MVRNFYQPDPGPDWTKRLNEIYARQTRQRNEHHQNLLQQSAELERADPGVRNLAMFKQILETTKTGVDVYNAFHSPEAKAKTAAKNKEEWNKKSLEEQNVYKARWLLDKKEIEKQDEVFFKKIKEQFKLKDLKAAQELIKKAQDLSGRSILRYQEASAAEQVQLLTNKAFQDHLAGQSAEYKKGYKDLDPVSKAKFETDWQKRKLDQLGYSKEVQSTVVPELNRKAKTKAESGSNLFKTTKEALELRQLQTQINAQSTIATPDDTAALIHGLINERKNLYWDIKDGPTATQQAVESVVSDLYQMGQSGKLTRDAFNKMLKGKIDGHSGGDTLLKAFFDKNGIQESHILGGIEAFEQADYDVKAAYAEEDYKQTFMAAANGELNQNDYNKKVEFFNRMPMKDKTSKLDQLDKVFNTNQGEEQTKADVATWQSKVDLGILEQSDIDSVSNTKANKILQAKFDLQEKAKDLGKVDSVHKGITGKVQQGKKGPFNLGSASIETEQVTNDIKDFYNKEFFSRVHAAGPDADFQLISNQALSATKDYMEVNGFGKNTTHAEAGKFSANGLDGDYTLYSNSYSETKISDDYLNANVEYNSTTAELWDANIRKIHNKPGYKKPKDRFAKSDGLYTNGMLGHFLETGEISDQMLYIAKKNGLNISRAIGYSINAKLNSSVDADKDFAKNFNIAQINTKDWPDQTILDKGYDRVTVLKSGGKDAKDPLQLLAQAKTQGFDSLSRNQMQRLFVHLEGEELTGIEAAKFKWRKAGLSDEEIDKLVKEEIAKRNSVSNTITSN